MAALQVRAGAKYFVALANHHDNFDNYDSKYHAWNSVNVGPKKDIVGTWAKVARKHGLRFGVTNHSAHSWHWFQTAYGYDGEGPLAGVRYDAFTLTKADGKGKWWDGLDPQELYTGPNIVMPDGHHQRPGRAATGTKQTTGPGREDPPPNNPAFTRKLVPPLPGPGGQIPARPALFRQHRTLPLGQAGLDIAAHYYNANLALHDGKLEAVVNVKGLDAAHRPAVVEDYERGSADVHPARAVADRHLHRRLALRPPALRAAPAIKPSARSSRMLVNIVSKNGNLLLNVPVRGDGTIDERRNRLPQGHGPMDEGER